MKDQKKFYFYSVIIALNAKNAELTSGIFICSSGL